MEQKQSGVELFSNRRFVLWNIQQLENKKIT